MQKVTDLVKSGRIPYRALLVLAGSGALYATYKILTKGEQPEANNPTGQLQFSLDNYLAKTGGDKVAPEKPKSRAKFEQTRPDGNKQGVPVLVLYGTEFGYSKEIAETLVTKLRQIPEVTPRIVSTEEYHVVDFSKEQIIFLICSTQGDGVPPTSAKELHDYLHIKSQPGPQWQGKVYSVLALGDSNYPHFCRCGKQFDARFEALGCKRLYKRVDIDQEDDSSVSGWIESVLNNCSERVNEFKSMKVDEDYLWEKLGDGQTGGSSAWNRNRPYFAEMAVKYPLSVFEDPKVDKETTHIEFDLGESGITYLPGDALGILPSNPATVVDAILKLLEFSGNELIPIPKWFYKEKEEDEEMPLREALLKAYDLKSIKVELLKMFQIQASDKNEITRLSKLFSKGKSLVENPDLAAYIKEREVLDVLREFRSVKLSPSGFLSRLKALLPRYYSISSTQSVDSKRVSVTIAIVRYNTLSTDRVGICSTFVQDRIKIGEKVPVYINANPYFRLPKDPSTPVIMVGPGTGIAPFRSFVRERIIAQATGQTVLYFGCRNKSRDFLYADELTKYAEDKQIVLRTAFSRDQAKKVYVQDLLREDSAMIWDLLQKGAHFYVCGDASQMAGDVHKALIEIAAKYGNMTTEEGEKYMDDLDKSERYQRDVWIS
jgi:sulfite reductase (NADPH) flavoprotein alpha-component